MNRVTVKEWEFELICCATSVHLAPNTWVFNGNCFATWDRTVMGASGSYHMGIKIEL